MGVPDTVLVLEEEAVEVTVLVAMEHREGVEDTVEVLLPPMDRVPEGEPVLVLEAVVVGVEVEVLTMDRVDLEDLEKEEDPEDVLEGFMDLLPQGEAEEVLDSAADREKVGVPVDVFVEDTEAVLVEVDFPPAPTPDTVGLVEEEEVLVPSPVMDLCEEEDAVLDTVGVFVVVIVEVVVLVVVEEGEAKEDALADLLRVVVLVAVLDAVVVALLATCRSRCPAPSSTPVSVRTPSSPAARATRATIPTQQSRRRRKGRRDIWEL